jgi:hypothetical protein
MKRTSAVLWLCLVIVCLTSVPAAEQASDKPPAFQWLQLTVVGVQPGMTAEWRKIQQEEVLPTLKKAGTLGREVWTTGVFGVGGEFVIVTPIQNLAQFDGQSPMLKALGPEAAAALGSRVAKLETGRRTYALRPRPDLSYIPDQNRPPKLAIVSVVDIAAGRNADFESLIKTDAVPAMKKAQAKGYYVSQVVYGGNTQEYITLVAYDTFEEISKGHPFEIALGQAGVAKMMQKTVGLVTRVDRYISRFVPELSFMPGRPTSND